MSNNLQGARFLTTGDLARRTGTTPRAIRFYEQSGLLVSHERGRGGRRRYTLQDLERLQLINDLRDLDLSLDDIKGLLHIRDACQCPPELGERLGQLLEEQLERTQQRLCALRRLRDELAAAAMVVRECLTCTRELASHPCKQCDNINRAEAPRMMKVLLGQCGGRPGWEGDPSPLVPLRTSGRARRSES